MTTFDNREKGFENEFVRKEKVDFAIGARASKLFGLWAAEKLGLIGEDAKIYAQSVVAADLQEAGFNDVLRKVRKDLDAKGISLSDHILDVEFQKALKEATTQINTSS